MECVNSTTILDGMDDYFGEDDHMAHHYSPQTWYTKLDEYQAKMHANFVKFHGSVFKEVSIVELGCLVVFNQVGAQACSLLLGLPTVAQFAGRC